MTGKGARNLRSSTPALAMLLMASAMPDAAAEIRDLPVPAAMIFPNTVITRTHVKPRRFKVTPTSTVGFATDVSQIVGKQTRRRLVAGKPIPLSSLSLPYAVRRGAVVAVLYQENGFSITASLVALADGAEGDVIEARNTVTGSVVTAKVRSDGTLAVESQ